MKTHEESEHLKTHGVGVALRQHGCKELGPVSGRGNSFPTFDAESEFRNRSPKDVQGEADDVAASKLLGHEFGIHKCTQSENSGLTHEPMI